MEGRTRMICLCSRHSLQGKSWQNIVWKEKICKKKKTCCWHGEFVLGWKVKPRNFNCHNSKNVSSAYWSNTDISIYSIYSNLYKYRYLFPQKVKSQIKRLLDIKKSNQMWTSEPIFSNAPSPTCSVVFDVNSFSTSTVEHQGSHSILIWFFGNSIK